MRSWFLSDMWPIGRVIFALIAYCGKVELCCGPGLRLGRSYIRRKATSCARTLARHARGKDLFIFSFWVDKTRAGGYNNLTSKML